MRLEGWEARLVAVIESARGMPYVLGRHDCFRVACRVVEALTGVDRWPEFAGYTTKREALHKLAAFGSSFEDAGDNFFGVENCCNPMFARRGDIAAIKDESGEKHLGIILGSQIYCTQAEGAAYLPLHAAHGAWRVG